LTVKAEVLDSSINWLTKTGIYNNDESNKMAYGGFNAYYDERRKHYPFESQAIVLNFSIMDFFFSLIALEIQLQTGY